MQFRSEQTDVDRLSDIVSAAMETGNAGAARLALAEHSETFPKEVESIRSSVLREYGVKL